MDIHEVVATVQRRKEQEAVRNELELRAAKQKDAVFEDLRRNLQAELNRQVAAFKQQGITLYINAQERDTVVVNRDDSAKTLTISFAAIFHQVAFNYDGGAVFKRSLTVESETRSGLLGSREQFYYRRENNTVVQPQEIPSFVTEVLKILLV